MNIFIYLHLNLYSSHKFYTYKCLFIYYLLLYYLHVYINFISFNFKQMEIIFLIFIKNNN